MEPVQLYYRPGDVGDGDRWEAVCGDVSVSGRTAANAFGNLADALKAKDEPPADEA